jgi:hypothetical protein
MKSPYRPALQILKKKHINNGIRKYDQTMPVFFYKLYQVFFTPFPIWVTGLVIPDPPNRERLYHR